MNDKSRDDSDFSLNHFDATDKETITAPADKVETDRQEPAILEPISEPEIGHNSAANNSAEEEPLIPPPPAVERKERSNFNPMTIFAALTILIVAIAFWSNIDDSKNAGVSTNQETDIFPATGLRMQSLDNRITSLEQQGGRQNNALMQQVERLQEQVDTLTRQVNEQARILHTAPAGMARTHRATPVVKNRKPQPAQNIRPATTAVKKAATPKNMAATNKHIPSVKQQHTARPVTTHKPAQPTPAQPVTTTASGWVVSLISVDSLPAAKKAQADFASKGVVTEVSQGQVKGKTWYRVRVVGFASKQEALAQQQYLSQSLHIKDTWVHKL